MEYKKIENLVYKNNLLDPTYFKTRKEYNLRLDMMLIDNLKKCIEKRVPIDMNEDELSRIYKIYLKLIKNNIDINKTFITELINLSTKKLDYLAIIQNITE